MLTGLWSPICTCPSKKSGILQGRVIVVLHICGPVISRITTSTCRRYTSTAEFKLLGAENQAFPNSAESAPSQEDFAHHRRRDRIIKRPVGTRSVSLCGSPHCNRHLCPHDEHTVDFMGYDSHTNTNTNNTVAPHKADRLRIMFIILDGLPLEFVRCDKVRQTSQMDYTLRFAQWL